MTHKEYLTSEFWILSWNASVQRASIYRRDRDRTTERDRKTFRKELIRHLEKQVIPIYESTVSEEDHLKQIQALSHVGTKMGSSVLDEDGYKIGVAQKLLNLQLKYLWCIRAVAEPPHCPVDRVIIGKTYLKDRVAWTKIVSIDEYKEVISAIRQLAEADGLSIPCWELKEYDRSDA
jgi:septin family protein